MGTDRQIRVVGEGAATGTPDRCVLYLALRATADTTAEAVTQGSRMASAALESCRAGHFGEEGAQGRRLSIDAAVTGLSIENVYDDRNHHAMTRTATYSLAVSVPRLDDVGDVISTLAPDDSASVRLLDVELLVGDPQPVRRQARHLAVSDAQRKAAELAEASGVTLGELVAIEELTAGTDAAGLAGSAEEDPGAPPGAGLPPQPDEARPMPPDRATFSSSVVLTYALKA